MLCKCFNLCSYKHTIHVYTYIFDCPSTVSLYVYKYNTHIYIQSIFLQDLTSLFFNAVLKMQVYRDITDVLICLLHPHLTPGIGVTKRSMKNF